MSMECKHVHELLFDLEAGQAPAAVDAHVRSCGACAAELAALRKTMSLLDSWTVPEPTPYFDTRLQARLHEQANERVSWWAMIRRPAMALAFTLLVAVGVSIQSGRPIGSSNQANNLRNGRFVVVSAQPGTAVGDLQALDKDHDLIANIELLDDVSQDGADQMNP